MSIVMPLRVAETTATTGTGSLILAGVPNASYRGFAEHYGAGTSAVFYVIEWDGGFEIGLGTFNGTDTITRVTILRSSNGDAIVSLPAGAKTVFALLDLGEPEWGFTGALAAADVVRLPGSAARFTGGSAATVALPAVASLPRGFAVTFINAGSDDLTLDPDGTETIGGASTLVLSPGQRATIVRRAAGWEAVGPAASTVDLSALSAAVVLRDGSQSMIGNLLMEKDSPFVTLSDTAGSPTVGAIRFARNGVARWQIYKSTDETLRVSRHDDSGAPIGDAININRSTGVVTLSAIPVGPAENPTAANQLARKQYVDDVGASRAPQPQASAGVGQFVALTSTISGAAVLPSGGTWAYAISRYYSSWFLPESAVGIAAGGSTVGSAQVDTAWRGWCWRVA